MRLFIVSINTLLHKALLSLQPVNSVLVLLCVFITFIPIGNVLMEITFKQTNKPKQTGAPCAFIPENLLGKRSAAFILVSPP